MGLKDTVNALIDANIYANGEEKITGQGLNATLKSVVEMLPTTDEILTGINGTATESNAPNMGAGFFRYIVTAPITAGSAWGIEVTQTELDDNWVFFNVKDGVITKDSKPQQAGKSAYAVALDNGFVGTEAEWLESLNGEDGAGVASISEFSEKSDIKSTSPSQLFSVIGDFNVNTSEIAVNFPNTATPSTLSVPSGTIWGYADRVYNDFTFIESVDIFWRTTGDKNILIYKAGDYHTPYQTVVVNVSVTGYKNTVFNTPLDASKYRVYVSNDAGYTTGGINSPVHNLIDGQQKPESPTLLLGLRLNGKKILLKSDTIVEQINAIDDKVEQLNLFTNTLYQKSKGDITSIAKEGVSSIYTIDANGLNITSYGIGNGVLLKKPTNLNMRYLELKVRMKADTIFYMGTSPVDPNVGKSFVIVDSVAQKLKIYNLDSTTAVAVEGNIDFAIVADREYILRLVKMDDITRVEITDGLSSKKSFLEFSQKGQFDEYKFGIVSSTAGVVVTEVAIKAIIDKQPFIIFYGDSITEGNSVFTTQDKYKYAFPHLIGDKMGKPYLVSGRSGGIFLGLAERVKTELPALRPKYAFITIGTNGSVSVAELQSLVDYCNSLGVTPILNLIPARDNAAPKNTVIQQVVDANKLLSVKTNIATSVNYDGVTRDNAKFADEAGAYIHPNLLGNQEIYKRALVDIKDVFSETGAF